MQGKEEVRDVEEKRQRYNWGHHGGPRPLGKEKGRKLRKGTGKR